MFTAIADYLKEVRNKRTRIYHYSRLSEQLQKPRSIRSRIKFSFRFYISIVITSVIVLFQILLFHHYIGFNNTSSPRGRNLNGYIQTLEAWNCFYPGLLDIFDISNRFGVDLVVIDPDLIKTLDDETSEGKQDDNLVQLPAFSKSSKSNQESSHKAIVHLAAINETGGGQPNLKLFYNALINNGYSTFKYDDPSELLHPEVYRRAFHISDDIDTIDHDKKATTGGMYNSPENEVSKIYTEFITHIFVLNRTVPKVELYPCRSKSKPSNFITVHIVVLYNYEYDPAGHWIQPALLMDELDKHKLLSANVHSFDFRIPLETYFIHPKRDLSLLIEPSDRELGRKKMSSSQVKVLEPKGDRMLGYANNTYVHCKQSQFDIEKLIDNPRKLSKYLIALDNAKPISDPDFRQDIQGQLVVALKFVDTFARAYGNLSYWLTGSTLLAYYKFCDLAVVQPIEVALDKSDIVVNLELGFFASEMNDSILDDLAYANSIGVIMLSDWRGLNNLVIFQFRDCPNLVFHLYLYELRRDFYQYYFSTRSTMTMNHKFNKRSQTGRSAFSTVGHHIFNTNNLDLCWSRADNLHPSRVPCNTYDHLRRIYVI